MQSKTLPFFEKALKINEVGSSPSATLLEATSACSRCNGGFLENVFKNETVNASQTGAWPPLDGTWPPQKQKQMKDQHSPNITSRSQPSAGNAKE
jgi:hypothetical protein